MRNNLVAMLHLLCQVNRENQELLVQETFDPGEATIVHLACSLNLFLALLLLLLLCLLRIKEFVYHKKCKSVENVAICSLLVVHHIIVVVF